MQNNNFSKPSEHAYLKQSSLSSAIEESIAWTEKILKVPLDHGGNFRQFLGNGVVLCNLMNAVFSNTIKRINYSGNKLAAYDNISLFLESCESKCKIPRSKLFTHEDFKSVISAKDGIDQTNENQRHLEKVVLSIFWFAKSLEGLKDLSHLPKLNYSAFSDLFSKSAIQAPLRTSPFLQNSSVNATFNSYMKTHSGESPSLNSLNSMGNPHSIIPLQTEISDKISAPNGCDDCVVPTKERHQLRSEFSLDATGENNSCLEEEEWQSILDNWRERRRREVRQEATNLVSLQERERQENEKRKAMARDRLRNQRHSFGATRIATYEFIPPQVAKSPGVALLTGAALGFPNEESTENAENENVTALETSKPNQEPQPSILKNGHLNPEVTIADDPIRLNIVESHQQIKPENPYISIIKPDDQIINKRIESDSLSQDPASQAVKLHSSSNIPTNLATIYNDFEPVKLRLIRKAGRSESRWGLTVVANGPLDTAPFSVERVKLGSSADLCDFVKGDILVSLDGINLGLDLVTRSLSTSATSITNLSGLEKLMDTLMLSAKPVEVQVLRHLDDLEELNEADESEMVETNSPEMKNVIIDDDGEVDADDKDTQRVIFPSTNIHKTPNILSERAPVMQPLADHKTGGILQNRPNTTVQLPHAHNLNSTTESDIVDKKKMQEPILRKRDVPASVKMTSASPDMFQATVDRGTIQSSEIGAAQLSTYSQSESTHVDGTRQSELGTIEPTYMTLATSYTPNDPVQQVYSVRTQIKVREDAQSTENVKTDNPLDHKANQNSSLDLTDASKQSSQTSERTFRIKPRLLNTQLSMEHINKSRSLPSSTGKSLDLPTAFKSSEKPNEYFSNIRSPSAVTYKSNANIVPQKNDFCLPGLTKECHDPSLSAPPISMYSADEMLSQRLSHQGKDMSKVPTTSTGDHQQTDGLYVNLSHLVPPPPKAPLPMPTLDELNKEFPLHNDRLSDTDEVVIDDFDGLEKFKTVKIENLGKSSVSSSLPPPPTIEFEYNNPPLPPRRPRLMIVNYEQMCIACNKKLGFESSMVIESLSLYYHLHCFVCTKCGKSLGDGSTAVEVRVRHHKLYCLGCHTSKINTENAATKPQNLENLTNYNLPPTPVRYLKKVVKNSEKKPRALSDRQRSQTGSDQGLLPGRSTMTTVKSRHFLGKF